MDYPAERCGAAPTLTWTDGGVMDTPPFSWADTDGATAVAARLLFVGPAAAAPDAGRVEGVRLVHRLPASRAAGHIRQMAAVDIVWLAAADAVESELLADLCAAVAERECSLVCETSLAALDRVAAIVPARIRIEWLVDADAAERLIALTAARAWVGRERTLAVHDVDRDDAMERIDRLQDEVARISRMLGELAGKGGAIGPSAGFAARSVDFAAHPGQVHAPARDFIAGPRSFVPEDRTVERQRAKQVRRLLRQRRMREQYFPADLFADPAWDMLLDLYAARLERQPVSVSSLCIAAAVPATTALRWIKTMTDAGLFLREADPQDGRRIFIALAEGAAEAMARYFDALED